MYLTLMFLALWTGIARAQLDIPTGMMMGMDTQQAMLMEMNSAGGTGGGMGTDMGWGMGGGGGGGRRGGGNAGGSGGGMSDMMGGGGGGSGGNMETMGSGGGGGNMENMNGGGGGLPGNGMTNRQQNMGRFNMGGGGGSNANNNNMGGNSAMMTMMLCRETPSRFGEMPCNVNNPSSCPMSQYLSCKSGVYFYPVCCAKDWRSLRIVDVMF